MHVHGICYAEIIEGNRLYNMAEKIKAWLSMVFLMVLLKWGPKF